MISLIRRMGYASPYRKFEILEARLRPNKYAANSQHHTTSYQYFEAQRKVKDTYRDIDSNRCLRRYMHVERIAEGWHLMIGRCVPKD